MRMTAVRFLFISFIFVACTLPGVVHAQVFDAETNLKEFKELSGKARADHADTVGSARRHSQFYARSFQTRIDQVGIDALQVEELATQFTAAAIAAFYSKDVAYTDTLERLFARLLVSKKAKRTDFQTMYDNYLVTRNFAGAQRFLTRYPSMSIEPLPTIVAQKSVEARSRTEWVIDQSSRTLTQTNVDIPLGPYIVIISSPQCGFSQAAIKDIADDATLARLMKSRTKYLAPPDSNLNFNLFQEWNRTHPEANFSWANKISEWPEIGNWDLPTFYFLFDRKIVATMSGWPAAGRRKELLSGLKKINLE
jgi:hypothetical protein